MIREVGFINGRGQRLKVSLHEPEKSGLAIKSITGLGPVSSSVSTTDIAVGNGAYVTNTRTGTRNIVVNFAYLDNPDIETTRLMTYRYFVPNEEITVQIRTDKREVYTVGYVETNEPDIFSSLSGCQISIICPDPYFYDIKEITIEETVVMKNLTSTLFYIDNTFKYDGELRTGIHAEISFDTAMTDEKLYFYLLDNNTVVADDAGTFADLEFDYSNTDSQFTANKILCIDTGFGTKQIYMLE